MDESSCQVLMLPSSFSSQLSALLLQALHQNIPRKRVIVKNLIGMEIAIYKSQDMEVIENPKNGQD